ncbi:MAG: acetyltransferase [Amycolatopsis sp.]|uniref:GNAT family N-acetyltransferase n=1 Tax=Amycolatopsis sp. TaxID=37632 RepID=UPI0026350CC4|nr:GNAT family N-acetyltransferase [Amycolatopsis sp.]MCU1687573.1 acetyltransferase [Amycolatopsis sp.]
MDLLWRPLTFDDMAALAEMYATAEVVDPTGEHYSAEDLAEELSAPGIDLASASTSAWDGERLVAYAYPVVRAAADPVHLLRSDALVHPDYRDEAIGTHLIEWLVQSAKAVHERAFPSAPLELHAGAYDSQQWYTGVLQAAGFEVSRTFADMRADLADLPPAQPLPSEYPLVRYEQKYEELMRQARNDTFSRHWGSTVQSPEGWRHLITGSKDFVPELTFLLLSEAKDEVLAFVQSSFYASDAAATGVRELHIGHVGTRDALRGRGVATALLGYTLAEGKAAGYERASLSVDVENAGGALGIYERCGFHVAQRTFVYIKPL